MKYPLTIITRHRKALAAILSIHVASALLVSVQPGYFQRLVSLALAAARPQLLANIIPLLEILAAISVACAVLNGIGGYLACRFSSSILHEIQCDFFRKINALPLQSFDRQSSGEFVTRFNQDIGNTQVLI